MSTVDQTEAPANPREAAARREARRQRRIAAADARLRDEARARQRRRLIFGGGALLVLIALGALVYWLVRPDSVSANVQSLPNLGQVHIAHGQTHPAYNSKPPTSGWHYADAVAAWGVATTPWPDELQVHALEHGGVIASYDCPSGCPDTVSKLEQIVRSYPSKVILQPYPGIGHPIALTAWTKLAYLEKVDEGFIRDFIYRYKNKAPEQIPD